MTKKEQRQCEERSDGAIQEKEILPDCFTTFAMTKTEPRHCKERSDEAIQEKQILPDCFLSENDTLLP
jgi:hypothetical protein